MARQRHPPRCIAMFELALTHEALTQNPANAATMPSKASVGEEALVTWVAASAEASEAQLVTLVDVPD